MTLAEVSSIDRNSIYYRLMWQHFEIELKIIKDPEIFYGALQTNSMLIYAVLGLQN